jgi:ABC-type sugar transport system ATPase subunit
VYIFQPASSGASVKNNVFDKPARANLQRINNRRFESSIMTGTRKDYNKCIILDDQGSYLKNKELQRLFNLCFNRRHLGVSIYF